MNEIPTLDEGPDEADKRYRRWSDRDSSGPSEEVRRAVLQHAAQLAAQVRTEQDSAAMEGRTARRARRRIATYGGLAAAAVLAGFLVIPHFLTPPRAPLAQLTPGPSAPSTENAPKTGPSTPKPAVPPTAGEAATDQPTTRFAQNSIALPRASASQPQATPSPTQSSASRAAAPPSRVSSLSPAASLSGAASPASPANPVNPAAALREAAQDGNMRALQRLLAENREIDARDASGRTALMLAVLHGQQEAVNALLAAGADPNAADASGTTPLRAALAGAHSAIAAALEQSGAR